MQYVQLVDINYIFYFFRDSLVATLYDPSLSFNLQELSLEVMGVDNVTIIIWNSEGEIIVNTTVSNDEKPTYQFFTMILLSIRTIKEYFFYLLD